MEFSAEGVLMNTAIAGAQDYASTSSLVDGVITGAEIARG